ncbi:MAG: hypothetical protein ACE5MB_11645, partial [Anaerolineae bacterium]
MMEATIRLLGLLLLIPLLLIPLLVTASPSPQAVIHPWSTPVPDMNFQPGQVLVKLKSEMPNALTSILAMGNLSVEDHIPGLDVYVLTVPRGEELAMVEALRANPAVQYAELNYLVHDVPVEPEKPWPASEEAGFVLLTETITPTPTGTWTLWPTSLTNNLNAVAVVPGSDEVWAVGDEGVILHYADGRWSLAERPSLENLYDVHMVSADEGWAVGDGGRILRYQGDGWSRWPASPTPRNLNAVHMLSAEEGWAVGEEGTVIHYTGGGWSSVASPTAGRLNAVYTVSSSDAWAVGDGGTILRYGYGQWYRYPSPVKDNLYAIHMVSPSEGWIVGEGGVILEYSDDVW